MVKRLTMLLAGLFLSVGVALAQSQVSGTVVDENGDPVVGAAVRVAGTKTGTVTDINGHFSISAPANSSLNITYIGMQDKTVKAGSNLKITLVNSDHSLDEVMVVAYGTQSRSSFTGSAAVVNSEDLSKKISTNVADALVGTVPGLQITGSSGQPGASQGSIHIRGIASLYAATDPLIVVDGAPYSASLSNIPQDDIESVTVLKDAASAALYGARGAAGVILITTKKGDAQRTRVNLEAKWGGTSRAVQRYKTIDDPAEYLETYYKQFYNYAYYKQGMSVADANQWVNDRIITGSAWGLQRNPFSVPDGENLIGTDGKLNPHATIGRSYTADDGTTYYIQPDDWTKAAYHNGNRQEYTANISGGGQKGGFYTSLGYLNEDGIIDNSGYERFTGRVKADFKASNWLDMTVNASYVHSNMSQNPNLGTNGQATNMAYYTQYIAPIYPLYVRVLDANGNPVIKQDEYGHNMYDFGTTGSYPGSGTRLFLANGNPVGANKYNEVKTIRNIFQGQYTFNVHFTSWLWLTSNNTISYDNQEYSDYENPYIGPSAAEKGVLTKQTYSTFNQNYSQVLNFHKEFGLNDVQVQLGHEWYKTKNRMLEAVGKYGFSPDIKEINAFAQRNESYSYNTTYNVEGYFGNALYNYDQKYFANASYRRDASSRFAKDHRWGDFWSLGAAWIISKENFFKNLNANWIDNLKLKISYGQQGNDGIGNFNYVNLYSLTRGETSMLPTFSQLGNEDITWETTNNFNVGVEFALLNNRITGEFNYFNKKTKDLLFWLSIPESYGARGYFGNMGDIRNRGVELTLGVDVIRTKNINWNITGNISTYRTKILSLPESKTENYGGFAESTNNQRFWYVEGGPMYNLLLKEYAGVNEQGEALYWVDDEIGNSQSQPGVKHDRTTTDWSDASYYTQGTNLPKAQGGFQTSARIYDFDVSATFDYQIGGHVMDTGYQSLMANVATSGNGYALSTDILKSWTPNNTSTSIPRYMYGDLYTNASSTRWRTSARYLNFQSFMVGYTVPKSVTRLLSIDKVRVYIQGENLCFWSARKGLDPRYAFTGYGSYGVAGYAPVRTIMGGIQVSF